MDNADDAVPYPHRILELSAFDLAGFTKIVKSGGELYGEVRSDGGWEILRSIATLDGLIYGVASLDKQCPPEHYRYTLAVKKGADSEAKGLYKGQLFALHVKQSSWAAFTLEHFGQQYGGFWHTDPYKMIQKLGYSFNPAVGIHIDVYPPTYLTDDDEMEFWMPIRPARPSDSGLRQPQEER